MGWQLFSADVSQAFLRGLTVDDVSKRDHDIVRGVQFTAPPGSVPILQQLPGFENFNPFFEVLNMIRCGFGLKDAQRLWVNVLKRLLEKLGLKPTNSDKPFLFGTLTSHLNVRPPPSPGIL